MKKVLKTCMMALAILTLANGCKDDNPEPNNNNGGGGGTTAPEQYILMNNIKVKIKNPPNGKMLTSPDTTLEWAGNLPTTLNGDSVVRIEHFEGVKKVGSVVDEAATDYGQVYIAIAYGQTSSATSVRLTAGDYKIEKVNGVWYSVLKNGVGKGTKGSTTVNYTGLEIRIAWPSNFK